MSRDRWFVVFLLFRAAIITAGMLAPLRIESWRGFIGWLVAGALLVDTVYVASAYRGQRDAERLRARLAERRRENGTTPR